jgi:hypothetical protein
VSQRVMYNWLYTGWVQCAVKRAGRWTASRNRFRREFGLD